MQHGAKFNFMYSPRRNKEKSEAVLIKGKN